MNHHSHNNVLLFYSDSIEAIELASKRDLIDDTTALEMEMVLGNLNTELITSYINHNIVYKCDVIQVLVSSTLINHMFEAVNKVL